jgi:hypothetical protein
VKGNKCDGEGKVECKGTNATEKIKSSEREQGATKKVKSSERA